MHHSINKSSTPSAVSIEQNTTGRIGYPGGFLISHLANLFLGQVTSVLKTRPRAFARKQDIVGARCVPVVRMETNRGSPHLSGEGSPCLRKEDCERLSAAASAAAVAWIANGHPFLYLCLV